MKWLSDFKDYMVKDNFGLHLTLAYLVMSILMSFSNVIVSFTIVGITIILMEIYDKYYLRTKFSIKDIVAGVIGMILAFLVYKYGR